MRDETGGCVWSNSAINLLYVITHWRFFSFASSPLSASPLIRGGHGFPRQCELSPNITPSSSTQTTDRSPELILPLRASATGWRSTMLTRNLSGNNRATCASRISGYFSSPPRIVSRSALSTPPFTFSLTIASTSLAESSDFSPVFNAGHRTSTPFSAKNREPAKRWKRTTSPPMASSEIRIELPAPVTLSETLSGARREKSESCLGSRRLDGSLLDALWRGAGAVALCLGARVLAVRRGRVPAPRL